MHGKEIFVFPLDEVECFNDPFENIFNVETAFGKRERYEIIREKVECLEEHLGAEVFGQEDAVKQIAEAMWRFAAGINYL